MIPKVFVSHASEDKERFVLEFARKLRGQGIDAWLDKWEMLPGDSLVDKIFEEGIKEAKAVIVILSKYSVEKSWIREELNSAFINRINNGSKLIPIILDDCKVPEVLKSTVWERIENLSMYEPSFERIKNSIFGITDKPPIGSPPSYIKSFTNVIGKLSKIDSLVLRLSCEIVLKKGDVFTNPKELFSKENELSKLKQEVNNSLDFLNRNGYINMPSFIGSDSSYQITSYGLEAYATACIPDYADKINALISAIVNEEITDSFSLEEKLNEPIILINHILDLLEENCHLEQSKTLCGRSYMHHHIYNISPSLRRTLNDN